MNTWTQVCESWDNGECTVFQATYGSGWIQVRPLGADNFEYCIYGHTTQHDRDWRPRDDWYNLAAANGDFAGMRYEAMPVEATP